MTARTTLALLFTATLASAAPLLTPSLPASKRSAAYDLLTHHDPEKRAAAFLLARSEGEAIRAEYQAALEKAQAPLKTALARQAAMFRITDPSFLQLKTTASEWRALADAARATVQTDHHKDAKKFAGMDRAFAAAERAHTKLARLLKPGQTGGIAPLVENARIIAELDRELAWARTRAVMNAGTLMIASQLESADLAAEASKLIREIEPALLHAQLLDRVTAAHSLMKWVTPEQAEYADFLNSRRVALGLRPYLLGERLSAACQQHSDEMVRLNYFAHESPVPENKSPWNRVKNAKFEGSGGGECIFAGSGSGRAAHTGWWYSDGHRLILYATDGDAQGIARAGGATWTFMNGSFTQLPL